MPWTQSLNGTHADVTGTAALDELGTNTPSWVTIEQVGPVTVYFVNRVLDVKANATLRIDPNHEMLCITSTRRPNVEVRGNLDTCWSWN